jgi:hypothetical protein
MIKMDATIVLLGNMGAPDTWSFNLATSFPTTPKNIPARLFTKRSLHPYHCVSSLDIPGVESGAGILVLSFALWDQPA